MFILTFTSKGMYHLSIMEVDMPYWKKMYDEMTPEERFRRVVEILSRASIRLLNNQMAEATGQDAVKSGQAVTASRQVAAPDPTEKVDLEHGVLEGHLALPQRGRVPFGQKKYGQDRQVNEIELALMKDIQRLAAEGLSSEQIAQWLNQEDKVSKRAGKWSRTAVWRILKSLKE
jgi:hypothetical protein